MNAVANRILSILIQRFEANGIENFNLENELRKIDPVTERGLTDEEKEFVREKLLRAIQYRESHDGAVLTPVSMVTDPRDHEDWYDGWLDQNDDNQGSYYWKRLEDFLSRELSRKYGPESAGEVVRSIDEATQSIMTRLANPYRHEFSYKGLVVGYVQSGKTANFTALIAKATDAGYKLIIVLAGIHNVLRRQTQVRLDRELTGVRDIEGPDNYIDQPGAAKSWNRLTSAHNDFSVNNLGLFENYCTLETPSIAVVKKNVHVLNRLIEYFNQASEELRSQMPVLIVDDEADQASIDGNANNPDSDPTRTNECIRLILGLFARKVYVGYTATPFANALIDMTTEHSTLGDDLYPRNFIVSLPQPSGYFGSTMVFQGNLSDQFVDVITDEGNVFLRTGTITDNLSVAIDQFFLSCAIRNIRGQRSKPMSMLVHVSHLVNTHTLINRIISKYVEDIKGRYRDETLEEDLKTQFVQVWSDYSEDSSLIRNELNIDHEFSDFESVWQELENVFEVLQVMELNSSSEDVLDYTTGEEIKVIAVGGNQLSRGLTLEGLMISYYLRASPQYDTLLQMARWFGYRNGYEDLTRVHTTANIWGFFEHLALVEEELRGEIYRYEEEGLTPLQMAVAIRDHRNLRVTARNKMGAAQQRQTSYSDSLNQTIWYPLNEPETLTSNLNLGDSWVRKINERFGFRKVEGTGIYLANRKVDGRDVLENFLNRYNFATRENTGGPGLDSERFLDYIYRRLNDSYPELLEWSVALVGNINPVGGSQTITLGGLDINPIQRSRKYTQRGYNIGVLTEPSHLAVDLRINEVRSPQNPLLLLYTLDSESSARRFISDGELRYGQRIDLFRFVETLRIDVLGIAVVLPISSREPNDFISQ